MVNCQAADGSVCNADFGPGVVRVLGASATGLKGQQTLATLTLEGIGSTEQGSPLSLTVRTLTDTEGKDLPH